MCLKLSDKPLSVNLVRDDVQFAKVFVRCPECGRVVGQGIKRPWIEKCMHGFSEQAIGVELARRLKHHLDIECPRRPHDSWDRNWATTIVRETAATWHDENGHDMHPSEVTHWFKKQAEIRYRNLPIRPAPKAHADQRPPTPPASEGTRCRP